MKPVPQIKGYYETYWQTGKKAFSGAEQGYAGNFRRWMSTHLGGVPPHTPMLEVGCGDASFTNDLARYSPLVTAIDISASQIAENAARFEHITFLQHDLADPLPFADATFGVIWCSEVLEHLFDPAFALREMQRVLRPGGKFLVTVPYHGLLKNLLIACLNFDQHYTPSNPHIRFYTKNTIARIAGEAGFGSIRTTTCGIGRPLRDVVMPTNILLSATRTP